MDIISYQLITLKDLILVFKDSNTGECIYLYRDLSMLISK